MKLWRITEPIFDPNMRRTVIICLEPEEAKAAAEIAKARGVERETLIRQWILEKLEESRSS